MAALQVTPKGESSLIRMHDLDQQWIEFEVSAAMCPMLALALINWQPFADAELSIDLSGDVMVAADRTRQIEINSYDALSWGRALWIHSGFSEENFKVVGANYRPKGARDNNQVRLSDQDGSLLWSGSILEGELLINALKAGPHQDICIQGLGGSVRVRGNEIGCELMTETSHDWLMPGELRALAQELGGAQVQESSVKQLRR